MSWTDDRVELLRRLWTEGLSASQIAAEIGTGITRNAVIGKVHRLGLSGRVRAAAQASRPKQRPDQAVACEQPAVIVQGNTLLSTIVAPEPEVAVAPRPAPSVVVPICESVTILDLRETMCRWPLGDPSHSDFRFCGACSSGGLPYCDAHRRVAYQPVHDRRRDRERREAHS